MMTISYQFQAPVRIVPTAPRAIAQSMPNAMQALSREEMEERRWQLEWERRNVED
jgi:hypothetical protein